MQIFVLSLIGGLAAAAASIAGRVLLGLGFGFVAYQGIDVALGAMKTLVLDQIALMPPVIIQVLSVTKVGVAINMIFSAMAARLVIMGLTSGLVTRLIAKG